MLEERQKELDSILDAALDELDPDESDDDDADGSNAEVEPVQTNATSKCERTELAGKQESTIKKVDAVPFGPPLPPPVDDEVLTDTLESVMKSLFSQNGSDAEEALEKAFRDMETQIGLNAAGEQSDKENKKKNAAKRDRKITSNDAAHSSEHTEVDETVSRLIDDMSKPTAEPSRAEETRQVMEGAGEELLNDFMAEVQNMSQKGDADTVMNGMMKQLLSKDLMYEPMKQVSDKFPHWLAKKKDELSPAEYRRFGCQYQYFQRIVRVYETEPDNTDRLFELMQSIQEYGQPPSEIIQELAPGLEFDDEGMPKIDMGMPFLEGNNNEQCNVM